MTLDEAKDLARRIRRDERRQPVIDLCDFLLTLKQPPMNKDGNFKPVDTGVKPAPTPRGGSVADTREAYNTFMREYMKQWRARQKEK